MLYEMLQKVSFFTKTENTKGSKEANSDEGEQFLGLFTKALKLQASTKNAPKLGVDEQIKNLQIENQLTEVQNAILSTHLPHTKGNAISLINSAKIAKSELKSALGATEALKDLLFETKEVVKESKHKDEKNPKKIKEAVKTIKTLHDVVKKADELGLKPSAIHAEVQKEQVPKNIPNAIKKALKEAQKTETQTQKDTYVAKNPHDPSDKKPITSPAPLQTSMPKESKKEPSNEIKHVARHTQKSKSSPPQESNAQKNRVIAKESQKIESKPAQKIEIAPEIITQESKKAPAQVEKNASLAGVLNATKEKKIEKSEIKKGDSPLDSYTKTPTQESKEPTTPVRTKQSPIIFAHALQTQQVAASNEEPMHETKHETKMVDTKIFAEQKEIHALQNLAKKGEKHEDTETKEAQKTETHTLLKDAFIASSARSEILDKSARAKETLKNFTATLKDEVQNYKPPLTKLSIELNPENLGNVELTITQRGQNLLVQVVSNTQVMQLFMNNTAEFKQQLSNVGFNDVSMSFSDGSGGGGFHGRNGGEQQKGNENGLYAYKTNALELEESALSTMEIILPKYA